MRLNKFIQYYLIPLYILAGGLLFPGSIQRVLGQDIQDYLKNKPADELQSGFFNPPAQARPHTWWHWMNGNITREGITADLEAMARIGLGGAEIFNIAGSHQNDIPPGPIDYLSPEWLDMVKHAANEAGRLGLELCIHNCAGWATSGGPWVKPEHASQKLVSAEWITWGNKRIIKKLPQPEVREGYYRDIAVFAIPTSMDGDYRVEDWKQKAVQRGGTSGRQPDLTPAPPGRGITKEAIVELTQYMQKDGTLVWDAPPGRWNILRLGYTPTSKTNHPSPESGRGLEIDKLSREALDVHWQEGIQPILDHLGPLAGKVLNIIHVDSYEAGPDHWTPRLREEFKKRRGYDPGPYLLALTGRLIGDAPATERFLWDFRRTVADLYAENYYGYFAELCHEHGLLFSTEPYFSAYEGLAVAANTDIPMGEFWVGGTAPNYFATLKLAASIAHTHGGKLVAAESFTARPEFGRWQNYPGTLKRSGDLAWTQGVNRFVFHRFTHQPWLDRLPGMTMGQWGFHFDRTNTWWEPGRAWIQYITRSQFLLQTGDFVGDVLCFGGEASPNSMVIRKDIKEAGYDYDACGTDIMARLEVEDGDLVLPSGKRYRLLLLPDTPFQTPALARKIRELVQEGATVFGPRPLHTPSLAGFPDSEKEVAEIGEEVWGNCDGISVKSNRYGRGQVFSGISPEEVLSRLKVVPAIKISSGCQGIEWIHRRTTDADIFFISNQSGSNINTIAGFRAVGRKPELWDTEKYAIQPAPGWTVLKEHVQVPLILMPDESVFIVFRHSGIPDPDPFIKVESANLNKQDDTLSTTWHAGFKKGNELELRAWNNGTHTLYRASGKTKNVEVEEIPVPINLEGPWKVRFQPDRGAPEEVQLDSLISWHKHPDPGIRYFSGTATYSTDFKLPENFLKENAETWLDLGKVAVIAEVRINGKDMGVLWNRPFRIELSKVLRSGTNTLEIDVTNLWINRLIGDEQYPDDCDWSEGNYLNKWPEWINRDQARPETSRITFTTWKHWDAGYALVPSGLIGPVTLRCARLVPLP